MTSVEIYNSTNDFNEFIYYDTVERETHKDFLDCYETITTFSNNIETASFVYTEDWLDCWPYGSANPHQLGLFYTFRYQEYWYHDENYKCMRRWNYCLYNLDNLMTIQRYFRYYLQEKRYIQAVVTLHLRLPIENVHYLLEYFCSF
jgi:hypothetical protein